MKYIFTFIFSPLFFIITTHANFSANIIENTKMAVVNIKTITNYSPYEKTGSFLGTGFIIDNDKGLIVTNRHVTNPTSASNYEITFYNGVKTEAKLKYYSQWVDVAFLEIDPTIIPNKSKALKISGDPLKLNDEILIIGNNSGEEFSIQTGTISSLLQTDQYLDTQNFRISLNIKGGSSGSPAVNNKGELVGIIHASSQTSASAINIGYLKDFYEKIKNNQTIRFSNPGFVVDYASLKDVQKYANFPSDLIKEYAEQFPDSMFKILMIKYVFFDSTASKYFEAGDIIWKLNGELVGPNLYKFQHKLNKLKSYRLEIYRNGRLYNFTKVPTYNTNIDKIKKFIYFGGATFYEADEFIRYHIGVRNRTLMVSNISDSGSFSNAFLKSFTAQYTGEYISPLLFNNKRIWNLEELEKIIPSLVKQKYFQVNYHFYGTSLTKLNQVFINSNPLVTYVKYNELDEKPRLFWFNEQTNNWESRIIT